MRVVDAYDIDVAYQKEGYILPLCLNTIRSMYDTCCLRDDLKSAAEHGHLACMKRIKFEKSPDDEFLQIARDNGHFECEGYLAGVQDDFEMFGEEYFSDDYYEPADEDRYFAEW